MVEFGEITSSVSKIEMDVFSRRIVPLWSYILTVTNAMSSTILKVHDFYCVVEFLLKFPTYDFLLHVCICCIKITDSTAEIEAP